MLPFALTIFTGAFLLFQVQPLIGKYILPWFGGSPGVWTTCLLFFQTLLLGGYAYAHFSSTRLKLKNQAWLHFVLLALALVLLPITPSESWKAHVAGDPTWHILLLLTASIGLPYFVLSSTGPLMQQWFSVTHPGVSPYRLYALSNIGSLLALLSYPIFFEVKFSRQAQATLWSIGLGGFVLLCGYCTWLVRRAARKNLVAERVDNGGREEPVAPPTIGTRLLWLTLPAIASVLLLATTNKLCQEVAVIPFLWVFPLGLYLVSFIVCFDHARWYRRDVFAALLVLGIAAVCTLIPAGNDAPMWLQVAGYMLMLFAACMICHGELFQLKPPARHLTAYFLFISAGGALGGFLVAVVAPAVFREFWEMQLGMWVLSYLVGVLCYLQRSRALAMGAAIGALLVTVGIPGLRAAFDDSEGFRFELVSFYREYWMWVAAGCVTFLVCTVDWHRKRLLAEWQPRMVGFVMMLSFAAGVVLVVQLRPKETGPTSGSRNFYGTLKVFDYSQSDPELHYQLLLHGATTHGIQFVSSEKSQWPTTYYGENSGVGLAIRHLPETKGRHLGLVGLGTGTLAAYGKEGDELRIYEINPDVEKLALETFSYIKNCPAKVNIVMGDARLKMEEEIEAQQFQKFDLLALDAFSSDAIPVHLLTKEAFTTYLKHLKSDGIIAVHISNRYLDLEPVVIGLAQQFGLDFAVISDDHDENWWIYNTTWILLSKNKAWIESAEIRGAADASHQSRPPVLWTDDHASLYQILK